VPGGFPNHLFTAVMLETWCSQIHLADLLGVLLGAERMPFKNSFGLFLVSAPQTGERGGANL
jgi:hypothetical protein